MGWFGGTTIFGNTHIYINEDDYCGHPNVTFWGCFVWVSKYLFLNIERFPGVWYFGAPWPGHWNEAQLDGYCIRWIAWWAHCPKVKQGFNMVSMWPLWAIVSLHPSLEKKQTLVFEVKLDPLDFHNVSNTLWGCFEDGPKPYPRQICSSCIYIYISGRLGLLMLSIPSRKKKSWTFSNDFVCLAMKVIGNIEPLARQQREAIQNSGAPKHNVVFSVSPVQYTVVILGVPLQSFGVLTFWITPFYIWYIGLLAVRWLLLPTWYQNPTKTCSPSQQIRSLFQIRISLVFGCDIGHLQLK